MTATTATRSRGRAEKAAGDQPTRDRLIAAARVAFSRGGYEGARVDDIARQAGANKQLVYHYFSSKAGLYKAVVEELYAKFRGDEHSIAAILQEPTAEGAMRRLASHLFAKTSSMNDFQRLLQDLNVETNRRHLQELVGVREAYAVLVAAVETILQRGVDAGEFRPGIDAKQFYISLAGVCSVRINNAATLSFMLDVDLTSKQGAAVAQEAAVALLLDGIRIRPAG